MKNEKIVIEENGLNNNGLRELILNILNEQINNYKIAYLAEWEKDHSTSKATLNEKIEVLAAKKEEIKKVFAEVDLKEAAPKMTLSINLEDHAPKHEQELAYAN